MNAWFCYLGGLGCLLAALLVASRLGMLCAFLGAHLPPVTWWTDMMPRYRCQRCGEVVDAP